MSPTLVSTHRRDLEALLTLALADLNLVWRNVDTPDGAQEALLDALPELASMYGSAAATLAADWYDELRDAEKVPGRFRAIPVEPELGRTAILARWGVGPLYAATPDFATAKTLVAGGFQRLVADADRGTVIRSLAEDPRGKGWSRQTTGKSCPFCVAIAGRGYVYSARTADFSSHDHCDCIAVPVYGNDFREVRDYVPSQRFRTQQQRDAHNARTRKGLRST